MSLKRYCDNCQREITEDHYFEVMITPTENKPGEQTDSENNAYGEFCKDCANKGSTLNILMSELKFNEDIGESDERNMEASDPRNLSGMDTSDKGRGQ